MKTIPTTPETAAPLHAALIARAKQAGLRGQNALARLAGIDSGLASRALNVKQRVPSVWRRMDAALRRRERQQKRRKSHGQ